MRCSENSNSIFCIQEHWLRPVYKNIKSINQLRSVHPSFDGYGVSAMKDTHNSVIRAGRPYGGTGFIFSKHFSPFLHPVLQYEGERVSVMKLLDADCTILIINVYFPFKQSGDEHRAEFLDLLGSIENIISSNPTAKFIITGDFNYNIYDYRAPFSQTIVSFLNRHGLICTHELDPSFNSDTSYTRCCVKSGTYSILDCFY